MDISSLFTTTQCFATSPRTLQVPFHLFRSQIYTSLRFSNSLFFNFSSSFSTIVFENVTDSVTNITTEVSYQQLETTAELCEHPGDSFVEVDLVGHVDFQQDDFSFSAWANPKDSSLYNPILSIGSQTDKV